MFIDVDQIWREHRTEYQVFDNRFTQNFQYNNLLQVFASNEINVEHPEYKAAKHNLLVYSQLTPEDKDFHSEIRLPVHLRYHAPNNSITTVEFSRPGVYFHCSGNFDVNS